MISVLKGVHVWVILNLTYEARRIRIEKLREHQYIKGYASCLESRKIEWDENRNVDQMWEQVK